MAKRQDFKGGTVAELQPDELNALRELVKEFIGRVEVVDNEIDLLKEDRKSLIEDYSSKLDMKTLKAALAVIKIQRGVQHQDAYDLFIAALEDPTV